MKKRVLLIAVLLFVVLCHGFASSDPREDLSYFNDKRIGISTGSVFDQLTREIFPDAERCYFDGTADMLLALYDGKIDMFMLDDHVLNNLVREGEKIKALDTVLCTYDYAYAIKKTPEGKVLLDQMNDFLKRAKESGLMKQLEDKWFSGDFTKKTIDVELTGENGEIRAVTNADGPPLEMMVNNKVSGYEVEMLYLFCKEYGYSLKIDIASFGAIIPSLVSGRSDIAFASMAITEERKQSVYMSEPTYAAGVFMTVKDDAAGENDIGFFASLKNSFYKNFVVEDRYKLILSGLKLTILISVLSAIFGTVLGFGICMMRRSKNKVLSKITAMFIRLIQGLPMLVLLMILYYIIFGKSGLSSVLVAVIGFSINFGVYVSEMMRTGIDSVAKGQIEAALAIGFTPVQTFIKVTTPQALRQILPVYKGEFISLVKSTSIVGYIAIQDLTKACDIIRSRTFEAFFPLLVSAVIYFILAAVLVSFLERIELRLDPKHRSRKIKGVVTE